jgi:hypothetical protein
MTDFLKSYFGKQTELYRDAITFPSFNRDRVSQQANVGTFNVERPTESCFSAKSEKDGFLSLFPQSFAIILWTIGSGHAV